MNPTKSETVKLPPLNLYWTDPSNMFDDEDQVFFGGDYATPVQPVEQYNISPSYDDGTDGFYYPSQHHQDLINSPSSCCDSLVSPDFSITPSPSSSSSTSSYQAFQFPPPPSMLLDSAAEDEEEEEERMMPDEIIPIQEELSCRWMDCKAQAFPSQEELVRHIERCHVDQRRAEDFTCFWAGCPRRQRPFNARYKLLIHMRVHSGEKPNRCSYDGCLKAFSRLENLKIHLRSHTGEKPYLCQYPTCRKTFSNSSDRAKHQRTHIDTKPYACQVPGCSKRYTDPSSLRKHVKNHVAGNDQMGKKPRNTSSKRRQSSTSSTVSCSSTEDNFYAQSNEWNCYQAEDILDDVFIDEALLDETAQLMEEGGLLFNELNRYVQDENGGWLFPNVGDDVERLCGLSSFV